VGSLSATFSRYVPSLSEVQPAVPPGLFTSALFGVSPTSHDPSDARERTLRFLSMLSQLAFYERVPLRLSSFCLVAEGFLFRPLYNPLDSVWFISLFFDFDHMTLASLATVKQIVLALACICV